jgi:serine/threonine protein kinase
MGPSSVYRCSGAFAKVYAGTSVATGEKVAIKVIDKKIVGKEVTPRALQTEVAVLKGVQHAYVIQLRGVYEDDQNLYIVTELYALSHCCCFLMCCGVGC